MSELKTFKGLRIVENLCYRLDTDLYLPVKKELSGIDRTHSLGFKKEDFKRTIDFELERARQEAITWINELGWKGKDHIFIQKQQDQAEVLMQFFDIKEEDLE